VKRTDPRDRARRAALRAIERAARAVEAAGAALSDWEGEFLDSVGKRLRAHGRAFADPAKGPPTAALSVLQDVKLREIRAKAAGRPRPRALRDRRPGKGSA
jgi:hypothetical protein